jgi:hypothetical protein
MKRKIDGVTAHNLKDDGTNLGSTVRRFRNGTNDVTSVTWINEHTIRVQQHVRLADGSVCTVDAHPQFNLTIHSLNGNGQPVSGSETIESTKITSDLLSAGIDQNGVCQIIPGVAEYIQFTAASTFASEFRAAGATDAGKPPAGFRYCFPNTGIASPFPGFNNGGLTLCVGTTP